MNGNKFSHVVNSHDCFSSVTKASTHSPAVLSGCWRPQKPIDTYSEDFAQEIVVGRVNILEFL